jgi:thymidylate kinase
VGAPDKPVARRDKNVQSPLLHLARGLLYLLDAIRLRLLAARLRQSDSDVVIFDRHLYDELANLPLGSRLARIYMGCISKVAPRPDIAFLLDADPAAARLRKPEYPLEFLEQNRDTYLRLARTVGLIVIPASGQAEVTQRLLEQISAKVDLSDTKNCPTPFSSRVQPDGRPEANAVLGMTASDSGITSGSPH